MHTILVVDDNLDSCRILAKLLTGMGNKAICVCSGQLAIDSLEAHVPLLVILDVMMPDMDGIEVLHRIRANPLTTHLPVIMYSAVDDCGYGVYAKSQGANDFWPKGRIDLSKLRQMVAPYMAPVTGTASAATNPGAAGH
jgi:CheY-like chemotaxis protein